jgi:hypothetical protein
MISPKFHLKFQTCFHLKSRINGNADVEDVVSEIDNVKGEVVGLLNDIGRKYVKIPSILVTQEFLVENGVRNMAELDDALPELTLSDFPAHKRYRVDTDCFYLRTAISYILLALMLFSTNTHI